jgi:hypothetical protein
VYLRCGPRVPAHTRSERELAETEGFEVPLNILFYLNFFPLLIENPPRRPSIGSTVQSSWPLRTKFSFLNRNRNDGCS